MLATMANIEKSDVTRKGESRLHVIDLRNAFNVTLQCPLNLDLKWYQSYFVWQKDKQIFAAWSLSPILCYIVIR